MTSSTNTNPSDGGVDEALLEKRLDSLRDTQESVQGLSIWCQANKKYSTTIIETWLKCLKRSPVEKRLTLFYLANDVVQHAKRKNDSTLINQWAVAVQKATPHVRSPSSISSAIARIFKIWEERNVYSRDAVADLLALLNTASGKEKKEKRPATKKPETFTASAEKVQKFDPSTMISKIKVAFKLKSHLGNTFRTKQYFNMKMEQLIGSIKDRQHGMEVIQELAQLLEECKSSEHKLQAEVEERRKLVEIAEVGIVSYENVRGEAGIVNTAYKNFTSRIESTREKVDEKLKAFQAMESPEPSFPSMSDFGGANTNKEKPFSFDMFQSTSSDSLKSISLPPKPTDMVAPSQYSDYSSGDQQSLYNSSLSTSYDIASVPWTNDTYTNMMSTMMQMQYQPPPQVSQEPVITSAPPPPPVFAITPSMQLQMQMQQQQVAALQQRFQTPQGYNNINNNYQSSQPTKSSGFGASDIGSIPLPPPENPPLPPPEPNLNLSTGNNNNSSSDPYQLPSEYTTTPNAHQSTHDSSFDSTEMESPPYGAQQPQYPYNNSQEPHQSYFNRNSGNMNPSPHLGPGPSLTSTPRPPFRNSGPRFPHQRDNSFNGYNNSSNETFDISSQGNVGGANDSQSLQRSVSNQSYDSEFGTSEGGLNGDEIGGNHMYDNPSPEFYDRSYATAPGPMPHMGMDSPRMPSPMKSPRMFHPNWRGGRGRPPFPPYDGGFRGRGRGMMRGGFDRGRGGRRGFR